ncbi:c-type cytochrome [uncultured Maribacter sp.]|uniref:c-type cytochrome n=1 Tax=uncultured Maribacter sp. TaxID=431308 RepID=UPI0030EE9EE9|tara:strand:+ start:133683 stop:136289 length:2607 start_codon:yes stop_codon:yes gene_type:complete
MKRITLLLLGITSVLIYSCNLDSDNETPIIEKVTIDDITLPKGFVISKLYEPTDNEQGSWVSIAKDDKGNFYASDQYGSIYKSRLTKSGEKDVLEVQKLDVNIGLAQGLLYHNNELFALVNSNDDKIQSGLYKIFDSNGDGELDMVKTLKTVNGNGEHGPHNIVLAPDGQSMYMVFGNHTDIPSDVHGRVPEVWDEDNLLPVIKDPSGHANSRKAPGGWVAQTDFEGKKWTLITVGTRNTYDIAFNRDNELFGFDSDMEYDLGMPWYRPIRLNHMTSGADFGWRTGTGKFKDFYPDNLSGIANLGQGSPTGLLDGRGLKFPAYYQKGLYLFDWSYGTMYHAKLTPNGSSFDTEITQFISGVPLPITNGVVGDDGAFYFLTGGRRLESGLYRVTYEGDLPSEILELKERSDGKKLRDLRKELEVLHVSPSAEQVPFIVKNLDYKDRAIRFSARVALEHLDYAHWKDEIKKDNSSGASVGLALAIARHGDDAARVEALNTLVEIDWQSLEESKKLDFIRAIDLLLLRMEGSLPNDLQGKIKEIFLPAYLASSEAVNIELCKILSFLQVEEIVELTLHEMETNTSTEGMKEIYLSGDISNRSEQYGKDVENMLANMPNQRNISYAKSLSYLQKGWSTSARERYFKWFGDALQKAGGKQYLNFIRAIQKAALANVPEKEQDYLSELTEIAAARRPDYMKDVKQPEGPGMNWTVELLMSAYEKNYKDADFENGKNMFKASLCISCHSMNGEGGSTGPELTTIGSRFTVGAIGEAIINPSGTIGDRYQYSNYHMKDGSVISGIEIDEDDDNIVVSTSAFASDITTKVRKDRLERVELSKISPMPAGLANRLNEQEITDLIAFMLSGGKQNKMKK